MKRFTAIILAFICLSAAGCGSAPVPPVTDEPSETAEAVTTVNEPVTTSPVTTEAATEATTEITPVTTASVTTEAPPETTAPITEAPVTTAPVTTAPVTEATTAVTTEPAPVTTAPTPETTVPATAEIVPETTEPTPAVTEPPTEIEAPAIDLNNDVVVYENDFSSADLSGLTVKGNMTVQNGALKAIGSSAGYAYVTYTLPAEYHGMDYVVEADLIGHTGEGGLLIGATSSKLTSAPSFFSGYFCTTSTNGKTSYIAYFNTAGATDSFAPGTITLPAGDLHLSATVYNGAVTFRVLSLDQKTLYHEFRYEPGDHESDIYNTFTNTLGICQSYLDGGRLDNFKVTVLVNDVIPALDGNVSVNGTEFSSAGLTVKDGVISGSGAMLSSDALHGSYKLKISVASKGISRVYFGMQDKNNGYAVELDENEQEVTLYKIENGIFSVLNKRANIIREGFCDITIDVHGGIATVYYDNYFEGDAALPKFEFYLDGLDGKFGIWLDGGKAQILSVGESTTTLPLETYLNPVNPGADPDMLFYEGTYYLYVYAGNDGSSIFTVYTSPDLVHFTKRNNVFTWDPVTYSNVNGNTAWSPNVFYNESDGLFYLFFAAEQIGADTSRRVYYASSDSPYGPFKHDGPLVPINPNVTEIDGHPFVGYDGKTYMSFSRYDMGGTIWLEEVIIKDGVVTAKPETATRVVIPDREWDNDGAMRLVEGGFVWKHNGYYYIIYATGSYSRHYGEAVAVSKNPLGPYEKIEYNPILNWNYAVDGPGDALIIPSPDGEELYLVYHRHYEVGNMGLRQTCVDLIEFVPDPDGGPDILVVRGPSTTPQKLPSNKYRYDVNRDGKVTVEDALLVQEKVNGDVYSGYYDVDANGSLSICDVAAILEKIKEGEEN
ncbi:MAG: family 43 glycosylhydrolase [Clostridia bacterium]|nr:family 43 glycosylhydrolase [Clostridia bacterium]